MSQFSIAGVAKETPELKETSTGLKFAQVKIEEDNYSKNADVNDKNTYIITFWNQNADDLVTKVKTNNILCVTGRIKSNEYGRDGETRYYPEMVGEKFRVLS